MKSLQIDEGVDQFLSSVPPDEQETGEIEEIVSDFEDGFEDPVPFSVSGERKEGQEEEEDEEDRRFKLRNGKEVIFTFVLILG